MGKGCAIIVLVVLLIGGGIGLYSYYNSPERNVTRFEEAINNQDFAMAHKCLKRMKHPGAYNWINRLTGSDGYYYYADKLFNAEITYLMNDNSVNSSDRLIGLIANYGEYGTPVVGVATTSKITNNNESYMISVAKYNQMLDGVMSRAISMKNQYLAEKLLNLYKPTLRKSLSKSHFLGSDEYSYEYSYEPKELAEEVYQRAVKEKKFE